MSASNLSVHGVDVQTVEEVVEALRAIRDAAAEDIRAPRIDGISCFSRLYTTITENVLATLQGAHPGRSFDDPEFLTRLDVAFARRYFAAIHAHERRDGSVPACWKVLFDHRRDPSVGHVNFAACGVNAHVNHDLALALLDTWEDFPPTPARRADYDRVNDIFAEEMDDLREDFDAFLAGTTEGGLLDRLGNALSDLLVRATRGQAWEAAERVWRHRGDDEAYRRALAAETARLDSAAAVLGWMILRAPDLP
ncbi:hypothetical protein Ae168Ps1_0106c [Pseudonocardia sp. Ae168_Ps1]|uniref:DUF5995 family protein n=1 Tax=unclassified Pseudonocardia TaxID=2619320 RepID=UPI00094AE8AF|nr:MULTISPECIES: DUF5995 family protein [unclassified Pseudonocardia]OLL71732.1 hypothetical protein Ae150APs1_0110c [Pseudonocardia sp. Ae150A_Ps1]OLL77700.1 hypothetical protein Ae168Ps1_0106c [Pseudonocardia sp. Ae168_Ps1]OLL88177.1 hypothetical protein Ae263Ps1_5232 [Pseudonocardia sp. Ae263_Ps1]OLL91796.1 hypothetical protein Ae356Ps1_1693c [Pseudonocardia sp. Ae356_Ps1]